MYLLDKLKAAGNKEVSVYFASEKAAVSGRYTWYRFRKMVEKDPELFAQYHTVLESYVARVDGVALVFEYREPLHIEEAIKGSLR